MTISKRLIGLMAERNISKAQLAKGTGISPRTIGDWEKKGTNPASDKIARISDFLGVNTHWLLTGNEDPANNSVHVSGSVSGGAVVQGINNGSVIVRNGNEILLPDDISEILRIAESLDIKRRHRLLDLAFTLESETETTKDTQNTN